MTVSYRITARENPDHANRIRVTAISGKEVTDPEYSRYMGRDEDTRYNPYGFIQMNRPREFPNFGTEYEGWRSSSLSQQYVAHNQEYDENFDLKPLPHPTELFTHVSPQIHLAFSDPTMRHHMPNMVAMAMKEMGAEHDVPMADSSLSPFSSRLSQKAAGKGLAVPHPSNPHMEGGYDADADPNEDGNLRYSKMPREYLKAGELPWAAYERDVTPDEVRGARSWLRTRLRGTQPEHQMESPQFQRDPNQGTLF